MFCNICGAKNDKDAIFCKNCGLRLNDEIPIEKAGTCDFKEEIIEPIVFDDEKKEKPENKNMVKIYAIIGACVIVFGILAYVISSIAAKNVVVHIKDYSSSYTQEEPIDEEEEAKKEEMKKQEKENLTLCKDMVKDLMDAVTGGQTKNVEKTLGFVCGDKNTLARYICDNLESEYIYDIDFSEASKSLTKEYFHSMGYTVTEAAKVGDEYIIKVSFTRLDIDKILRNMSDWDVYRVYNDIMEDYVYAGIIKEEMSEDEKAAQMSDALTSAANSTMRNEISAADLTESELEFVVANDGDEWFIVREASFYKPLEKEMSVKK